MEPASFRPCLATHCQSALAFTTIHSTLSISTKEATGLDSGSRRHREMLHFRVSRPWQLPRGLRSANAVRVLPRRASLVLTDLKSSWKRHDPLHRFRTTQTLQHSTCLALPSNLSGLNAPGLMRRIPCFASPSGPASLRAFAWFFRGGVSVELGHNLARLNIVCKIKVACA